MAACFMDCRVENMGNFILSLLIRLMIAVMFVAYSKLLFLLDKEEEEEEEKEEEEEEEDGEKSL